MNDDEAYRHFQRERIEAAQRYDLEQAKRSAGLVPTITPMRALILLFRENAIPMSDRNSYLWTLIEDGLAAADGVAPASKAAHEGGNSDGE